MLSYVIWVMFRIYTIMLYTKKKKSIKACKVGLQRSSKYHDMTNQNIDLNKCLKVQEIQIYTLQVESDNRNINLKHLWCVWIKNLLITYNFINDGIYIPVIYNPIIYKFHCLDGTYIKQ